MPPLDPVRIELATRLMPKMLPTMPTLVTMTLASGFQLARIYGVHELHEPRDEGAASADQDG